ncbi:MAG: phenylacetate--CoA ligase family protein [Acidimicrobiales bacterium]
MPAGKEAERPPMSYEQLIARQRDDLQDAYLKGSRRLRWDAERLTAERQRLLRQLLGWAADRSPFWKARLAGIDPATFTEADLPSLPILTKTEMMEEFDRFVTVPGLTLDRVNEHVDHLDTDRYLDGQYRVIATSGSGGIRALLVYSWEAWVTFVMLATRWRARSGGNPDAALASVFAASPRHVSGALHAFVGSAGPGRSVHLSATLPLPEIVAGLNAAQPGAVQGYPSIIRLLAIEALAGRLDIAPDWVSTCGEQCTQEVRDSVREAWGVEITDVWGCTEGIYAFPCAADNGLHLPDDLTIVEPVDADGNVVPYGQRSARVLLTNLYNRVQPLIRYEITDAMTVTDEPCPCGCAHRRITEIHGRADGAFVYPGGAAVHAVGLAGILLSSPSVVDLRAVQTVRGAEVSLVTNGPCDTRRLRREMVDLLERSGLADPEVNIREVGSLSRLWSGKVRQFESLPGT